MREADVRKHGRPAGEFDAYHKWLGIPPAEQPPDHYRLLGLAPFESDLDVIEAAAMRQTAHVRNYARGPHSDVSQQILNEIAAAHLCLRSREKKAAYDAELRAKRPSGPPTPLTTAPSAPAANPPLRPVGEPQRNLPATITRPTVPALRPSRSDVLMPDLPTLRRPGYRSTAAGQVTLPSLRRKHRSQAPLWIVGGGLSAAVVVVAALALGHRQGHDASVVANTASESQSADVPDTPRPRPATTDRNANANPSRDPWPEARLTKGQQKGAAGVSPAPIAPSTENSGNVTRPTTAENQPPTVQIVSLEPAAPEAGGSLTVILRGNDPEGDAVVFEYRHGSQAAWQMANGGVVRLDGLAAGTLTLEARARDSGRRYSSVIQRQIEVKPSDTKAIDRVVLWNTHNSIFNNTGTGTCNVVLLLKGQEVWRRNGVVVPSEANRDRFCEVPVPRVAADTIHVDITAILGTAGGLAEMEVFSAGENVARGCAAKVSGIHRPGDLRVAQCLTDGITTSAEHLIGYWLLPMRDLGWAEVALGRMAPPVKGPIDLLAPLFMGFDTEAGEWRVEGASLTSSKRPGVARLKLPCVVSGEYELTIAVKHVQGNDTLAVYLPIDGRQAMLALDSGASVSGIHLLDGRDNRNNETTHRGRLLGGGSVHTLRCTVRRGQIHVTCDGKAIIDWQGDARRLSIDRAWAVNRPDRIYLGSHGTSYRFTRLELTPLAGEPAEAAASAARGPND